MFDYAERQAAERRACPRNDVITQLLAPTRDGEPLSDLEFKNFFTLLIAAGNDTTRYTMTHGLRTMMLHPSLWRAWRADPSLTADGSGGDPAHQRGDHALPPAPPPVRSPSAERTSPRATRW